MITPSDIAKLPGAGVVDDDGAPVGVIVNSYADPDSGRPRWASVRRHTGEVPDLLVPLDGAAIEEDENTTVRLTVSIGVLAGSPLIHPPCTFTDDTARILNAYYYAASHPGSPTNGEGAAVPDRTPSAGGSAEESAAWVVRSEEQLHVRTETTPVERVRLRKVIVTEEKTITVTLRREEFRLVREPFDTDTGTDAGESGGGTAVGEGGSSYDLVLHEERPVISTEIVPVERIHVEVVRVTDTVPVMGTVRKEQIDIDNGHTP